MKKGWRLISSLGIKHTSIEWHGSHIMKEGSERIEWTAVATREVLLNRSSEGS